MPDIYQDVRMAASPARIFDGVSTPDGLMKWWARACAGVPEVGAEYRLDFGPDYLWRARVTKCESPQQFEIQLTAADSDWIGTKVGFLIDPSPAATWLRFRHTGWPELNEHFRISNHCWAMYLRILRCHLERGDVVPYENRLDV